MHHHHRVIYLPPRDVMQFPSVPKGGEHSKGYQEGMHVVFQDQQCGSLHSSRGCQRVADNKNKDFCRHSAIPPSLQRQCQHEGGLYLQGISAWLIEHLLGGSS